MRKTILGAMMLFSLAAAPASQPLLPTYPSVKAIFDRLPKEARPPAGAKGWSTGDVDRVNEWLAKNVVGKTLKTSGELTKFEYKLEGPKGTLSAEPFNAVKLKFTSFYGTARFASSDTDRLERAQSSCRIDVVGSITKIEIGLNQFNENDAPAYGTLDLDVSVLKMH